MYRPRSCYDNGKFARTLQEAFGPHAEWHVDRRVASARWGSLIVATVSAATLAVVVWVLR